MILWNQRTNKVRIVDKNNRTVEDIGDNILDPKLVKAFEQAASGWKLDAQGRITGGTTYDGMTPAEVIADRDAYRRMVGE